MIPNFLITKIRRLKEVAKTSSHPKYKLAAMIFDNNRTISIGVNNPDKWTAYIPKKFKKWNTALCAEMDALLKARTEVKGMNIVVIRVNNNGKLMMAKPCPHCEAYLEHVGIKNVYYTNNDEEVFLLSKDVLVE